MAAPLFRHQLSLLGFIHPPRKPALTPEEAHMAGVLFETLIDHSSGRESTGGYRPAILINESFHRMQRKDDFLEFFFAFMYGKLLSKGDPDVSEAVAHFRHFSSWSTEEKDTAMHTIDSFAEFLMDNFFIPLKAASAKTPQPTPVSLPSSHDSPPCSKNRVSRLRKMCLKRDRHRCVISRKFDKVEGGKRLREDSNSKDDDGRFLGNEPYANFAILEVAHIIPHSIMTADSASELCESKKAALCVLDMFDPDIRPLIAGPEIDSPYNALTLTQDHHRAFGAFEIYFKQKDPAIPHVFTIDSVEHIPCLRDPVFPITRELHLSPDFNIDPPSHKLLQVHCAIAQILKLSAAGEYIDKTLRDIEEVCVAADGSTDLGRLVQSRLASYSKLLAAY